MIPGMVIFTYERHEWLPKNVNDVKGRLPGQEKKHKDELNPATFSQ
jgi:hypothetical protein